MASKNGVSYPTPPIKRNQTKGSQTPSVEGPAVGHVSKSANGGKGGSIVKGTTGY